MAFPSARLMELMSEARHNVAKLSAAMILCGVTLGSAGLSLIIFVTPGGILLRLHGDTPVFLYYGALTAIVILGLLEACFGYWVVPRDRDDDDWRTFVGRAMLGFSIIALVLVAALGGSVAFLK